ncbi:hypothetical protein WAZ07_00170 [Bacillus sp. FJAT-51639]|uniref:DUF2750 domain-containing protein n=1 Tax=Bacillus bruguierae TaxID=3127667 RepID=A0ABU8FAN9_9BACI
MKRRKDEKELKAYAIGTDDYEVVVSYNKEIAFYWLREPFGKEHASDWKIWEFPLEQKVYIRDFGETTARELLKEIDKTPAVVFSKKAKNDFYENWLSHDDLPEYDEDDDTM